MVERGIPATMTTFVGIKSLMASKEILLIMMIDQFSIQIEGE
jgi:hypothetical protein